MKFTKLNDKNKIVYNPLTMTILWAINTIIWIAVNFVARNALLHGAPNDWKMGVAPAMVGFCAGSLYMYARNLYRQPKGWMKDWK